MIINVFQPLFTYSLFITAVGKNVKGLKVVYANDDHLPANVSLSIMCDNSNISNELEEYSNLGQLYVDGLRHHTSLDIVSDRCSYCEKNVINIFRKCVGGY